MINRLVTYTLVNYKLVTSLNGTMKQNFARQVVLPTCLEPVSESSGNCSLSRKGSKERENRKETHL